MNPAGGICGGATAVGGGAAAAAADGGARQDRERPAYSKAAMTSSHVERLPRDARPSQYTST